MKKYPIFFDENEIELIDTPFKYEKKLPRKVIRIRKFDLKKILNFLRRK